VELGDGGDLAVVGRPAFVDAGDFVGHNFSVDVFEPAVETAQIADRVVGS